MTQANDSYRQLITWQRADELTHSVFKALKWHPGMSRWLASQIGRSALSVPANIVEGYSRGSGREYLHFLEIARGSLAETEYYIDFLAKEGELKSEEAEALAPLANETTRLLNALLRSVAAKSNAGDWHRRFEIREASIEYGSAVQGSSLTPDS